MNKYKDVKGIIRGKCTACDGCDQYDGGEKGLRCLVCAHPPVKHVDVCSVESSAVSPVPPVLSPSQPQKIEVTVRDHLLSAAPSTSPPDGEYGPNSNVFPSSEPRVQKSHDPPPPTGPSSTDQHPQFTIGNVPQLRTRCQFTGCDQNTFIDLNEGVEYSYCRKHAQGPSSVDLVPQAARMLISDDGEDDDTSRSRPWSAESVDTAQSLPRSVAQPQPTASLDVPPRIPAKRRGRPVSSPSMSTRPQKPHPPGVPPQTPPDAQNDQPSHPHWMQSVLGLLRPRTTTDGPPAPPSQPPQPSTIPLPMPPSQSSPAFTSPPPQIPAPQPPVPPNQQCKLPGCTKKKFVEASGRIHDFCGRRHAQQFAAQGAAAIRPEMRCQTPGCLRQKCQKDDGTGYFDYCSVSCRNAGNKSLGASASTPNLGTTEENTCILPGCRRMKYKDPANGRVHDYCCRSHASQASRMSIVQVTDTIRITLLSGQEFQRVSVKFTKKWATKKSACPTLSFIFEITNTKLKKRWTAYQGTLGNKTVEEYYHGTKLTCTISTTRTLCSDEDCGICGISSGGLDRRCIQKNINFQRFGHGFYLAPNSSKCHDYTQGHQGYRAMLMCEVLPGNKYKLTAGNQKLQGPPQGYDSVYGASGGELNYDELVVYNPDCVMPRYVFVYQRDGIQKIAK